MEMEKSLFAEELWRLIMNALVVIGRKVAKEMLNVLKQKEDLNGALGRGQKIAIPCSNS